jgi:hypothetical protein
MRAQRRYPQWRRAKGEESSGYVYLPHWLSIRARGCETGARSIAAAKEVEEGC